jgi:thiamine monophosphate synthase
VKALFDSPVSYLVTSGSLTSSNFHSEKDHLLKTVRLAIGADIELVQIREKLLPARYLFELASEAAAMARGSNTRLLLNERFDIAEAAGLDGVHLTSTSIPASLLTAHLRSSPLGTAERTSHCSARFSSRLGRVNRSDGLNLPRSVVPLLRFR